MRRLLGAAVMLLVAAAAAADPLDGRTVTGVSVSGLRTIRESIVLAQMELRAGAVYSRRTADRDLVRLERLRVFSDVSIATTAVDEGVRVEVTVVETLRILPALSIAVSDESGVSVGPAIKVLSVKGRPQEFSAALRFGGEGLLEVSETSPFRRDTPLWHSAKLTVRNRDNGLDHFDEHSLDLDARVGLRLSDNWKAGAIVQQFNLTSLDTPGITLSTDDSDHFTGFGAIAEHDSRDSWTTPTRGWLNSVDAIGHVGSGDYATFDVDVRRYQPLARKQTLVATMLLTLQTGERGVEVPTYTDYALGGANTVRGWDFASRRGKHQFIASLEHRYTLVPTQSFRIKGLNLYGGLALAAFGDLGSAWNDAGDAVDQAIGGYGFGLRLFIPFVDVIRIDFSFGNGAHANVGINEKAIAQRNRVR